MWRSTAPQYVHFLQGVGEVALDPAEPVADECPYTWGDVLAMIRPEHWQRAEADAARMAGSAVVPFCWARRARFY